MTKLKLLIAKTPKEKLQHIRNLCQQFHNEGKRFTLLAPTDEALKFLDAFLWSDDLFVPHQIASRPTDEFGILTTSGANLNHSTVCLNVCPDPAPAHFEEIYDLLDHTTPEKEAQSNTKAQKYRVGDDASIIF